LLRGAVRYKVRLRGSVRMGEVPVSDEALRKVALFFPETHVEAASPEEAAGSALQEWRADPDTVVSEAWISHEGTSWVFDRNGELIKQGRTDELIGATEDEAGS
jgi:hypothetical protein